VQAASLTMCLQAVSAGQVDQTSKPGVVDIEVSDSGRSGTIPPDERCTSDGTHLPRSVQRGTVPDQGPDRISGAAALFTGDGEWDQGCAGKRWSGWAYFTERTRPGSSNVPQPDGSQFNRGGVASTSSKLAAVSFVSRGTALASMARWITLAR
jgi:hypothetical protein